MAHPDHPDKGTIYPNLEVTVIAEIFFSPTVLKVRIFPKIPAWPLLILSWACNISGCRRQPHDRGAYTGNADMEISLERFQHRVYMSHLEIAINPQFAQPRVRDFDL